MESLEPTEQTTDAPAMEEVEEAGDAGHNEVSSPAAPEEATDEGTQFTAEAHTDIPKVMEPETQAPMPSRGDGPRNIPQVRSSRAFR